MPGASEENVYYWYYATLALFQLQDESWRRWNVALKTQHVQSQQPAYAEQAAVGIPTSSGADTVAAYTRRHVMPVLEVYYGICPYISKTT